MRTAKSIPSVSSAEFPAWPHFEQDELAAVERVLRSGRVNYWTGSEVREFEKEYAAHTGTAHGIALANGTVSLELALAALGVGVHDEVITSPRTFIASASCVVARGATPIFADVDRESQNITAESIERVLSDRTKAIILVHLAGWSCDMDPILALARQRKIAIIEDCAQAHGATYKGRPVGSFGVFGSFSFCQDKIITTGGEGGMLVTDDEGLWARAWSFKDHGKNYEAAHSKGSTPGFRWLHDSFGTNWRMTEMQAAIGRVQLTKLSDWIARRQSNAAKLSEFLSEIDALRLPRPPEHIGHSFYKYYAFIDPLRLKSGWTRDRIMVEINQRGVPCFTGSCSEVYLERAFDGSNSRPAQRLPVARELGETSLMFLVHPTLKPEHMARTAEIVRDVVLSALR